MMSRLHDVRLYFLMPWNLLYHIPMSLEAVFMGGDFNFHIITLDCKVCKVPGTVQYSELRLRGVFSVPGLWMSPVLPSAQGYNLQLQRSV